MKKSDVKFVTRTCPYCGRIIYSMYEKQADYNIQAHIISCKERGEEKNGKSNGH